MISIAEKSRRRTKSNRGKTPRYFTVLIEQGEDSGYIATVPALKSCYTQAKTIPELLTHVHDVIELCLEAEKDIPEPTRFVGVQQVEVMI